MSGVGGRYGYWGKFPGMRYLRWWYLVFFTIFALLVLGLGHWGL